MPHILLSEEDAAEVTKIAVPSEKQNAVSRAITSFFLIVIFLAVIIGIIMIARNIAKKTQGLGRVSATSNSNNEEGGLSYPRPSPGLALPGISGGGSASSGGTPQSGTPASTFAANMVLVPAGDYIAGWNENGTPVKVNVSAFSIDIHEVTNQQYADFVRATGHKPPADPRGLKYNIWQNGNYPTDLADHPVVNVSYQDAEDYAKWVEKRLPTKEEWERANRGNEGFMFPWGNDYNPNSANGNQGKGSTASVGSFPYDRSPFGVFDLAGNVREWTSTPYSSGSQRWKVVKGGSFEDGAEGLSSFAQFKGTMPSPNLGFRCVKNAR